ncbi:MAG: hypothetical protein KAY37_15075, partial [Phycisphaerae bacterium]|nr:hypothetical protein [Phycisphaerae bacterium]
PHKNVAAGLRTGRTTGWKPVPHNNVAAGLRTGRTTGWKPVPHNNVATGGTAVTAVNTRDLYTADTAVPPIKRCVTEHYVINRRLGGG